MDLFQILSIVFLFSSGIYFIWLGISMIVNKDYRSYIADLWFENNSKLEQKISENSVKFFSGPLYILTGVTLIYFSLVMLGILPIFAF